jgi:hypothetical protein
MKGGKRTIVNIRQKEKEKKRQGGRGRNEGRKENNS